MAASVFQTMTEVRASNVEKAGQFLDYALARRIPSSQVKIKVKCTLGRVNFELKKKKLDRDFKTSGPQKNMI